MSRRTENQRREWALWTLVAADVADTSAAEMLDRFASYVVADPPVPGPLEASEWFRVERFEDLLPSPDTFDEARVGVLETVVAVEAHQAEIDEHIRKASPRWRIERMPVIDRTLLRMGVAELVVPEEPRPRATINGLVNLARRYGDDPTPRFVNGILDQIRRNLDIPFR